MEIRSNHNWGIWQGVHFISKGLCGGIRSLKSEVPRIGGEERCHRQGW